MTRKHTAPLYELGIYIHHFLRPRAIMTLSGPMPGGLGSEEAEAAREHLGRRIPLICKMQHSISISPQCSRLSEHFEAFPPVEQLWLKEWSLIARRTFLEHSRVNAGNTPRTRDPIHVTRKAQGRDLACSAFAVAGSLPAKSHWQCASRHLVPGGL